MREGLGTPPASQWNITVEPWEASSITFQKIEDETSTDAWSCGASFQCGGTAIKECEVCVSLKLTTRSKIELRIRCVCGAENSEHANLKWGENLRCPVCDGFQTSVRSVSNLVGQFGRIESFSTGHFCSQARNGI